MTDFSSAEIIFFRQLYLKLQIEATLVQIGRISFGYWCEIVYIYAQMLVDFDWPSSYELVS